ncbi:MAG: RNA polymerase factor sigma-70 [Acidobacteriota bacterium]
MSKEADELLHRLRSRDPALLEDLVREHTRPLYRAARGLGFPHEAAEDLVQEVFVTFLETLERFEGRSSVRTWLFGILYRKSFEKRRELAKTAREDSVEDVFENRFRPDGTWARPPVDLDQRLDSSRLRQAFEECLERLPPKQRTVFVLRDIEDFPTEEICKTLGVSRTNLFVLTFRARTRLRECLEEKGVGKK